MTRVASLSAMCAAIVVAVAAPLNAQGAQPLSLHDAETRALQNHPQVLAGQYAAQAGGEIVREVKSGVLSDRLRQRDRRGGGRRQPQLPPAA